MENLVPTNLMTTFSTLKFKVAVLLIFWPASQAWGPLDPMGELKRSQICNPHRQKICFRQIFAEM